MNVKSDHKHPAEFMPHLITFYRKLKANDIKVTMQQELDAYSSLTHIDLFDYEDFYYTLRANLVSHQKDVKPFNTVFFDHWKWLEPTEQETMAPSGEDILGKSFDNSQNPPLDGEKEEKEVTLETNNPQFSAEQEVADAKVHHRPEEGEGDDDSAEEMPLYSPEEQQQKQDFSTFKGKDLEQIKKMIQMISEKFRIRLSRRKKRRQQEQFFDFKRTIRKNIRHGGDLFHLAWKARKKEKNRLAVFCDVSGSMEIYSRFLIQFLFGLQKSMYNMETFVFSTRLSRVTSVLRRREYENAIARISQSVDDWAGGTKIGDCLFTFNRKYAPSVLYGKTVVIIISDGWDCGEEETLRKEMARLRKYAHHIIWLNPLMSNPQYEPSCMGMKTALPFLDQFLPLYNLDSLTKLGRALEKIN
jgi:uncharacterized protein with von Willebrand factor type A (vWA) domain